MTTPPRHLQPTTPVEAAQAERQPGSPLHCPSDQTILWSETISSVPVHLCASCHGISLPGDAFREIRAAAALVMHKHRAAQAPQVQGLRCASDGQPMLPLEYKGVKVLVCSKCYGVWLDREKLETLVGLVGVPRKSDLSKLGAHLPAIGVVVSFGNFEGVADALDFLNGLTEFIGNVADI
jgi:Zn-finger nucleic acid-binding protein